MGTILIILVGFVVYGIPFLLFLFVHYLYFKTGQYISRKVRNQILRLLFWFSYISFGMILIYTDTIWDATEPSIANEQGRYDQYLKYYSDSDAKFKKITISGIIDSQLNVEFAVPLQNSYPECSNLNTTSTNSQGKHKIREYIKYPLLKPGPYSIDIFLENFNKDTNCKYTHEDYISIYVYGNGRQKNISYGHIATFDEDHQNINRLQSKIICSDKKDGKRTISSCDFKNHPDSEPYVHGEASNLTLEITASGAVSGNTYYSQKPTNSANKFVNSLLTKVFIFDLPNLHVPAPSHRRKCKDHGFFEAVYKNDLVLVKKIIKNSQYFINKDLINTKTCSGTYALSIFAARGNNEMFMHVLENGARTNNEGQNIFRSAFIGGNTKIIQYLINNKILDVAERKKALKAASEHRQHPLAVYLLNNELEIINN